MAWTITADPLVKSSGLMPRYLRERIAAAVQKQASEQRLQDCPAQPEEENAASGSTAVDAVTRELRRRLNTRR